MFVLTHSLIALGLIVLTVWSEPIAPGWDPILGLTGLYILAAQLPATSVAVRRLHDFGASGWWVLALWVFPFPGILFLIRTGDEGDNRYGPPSVLG